MPMIKCPACRGARVDAQGRQCWGCNGYGVVEVTSDEEADVVVRGGRLMDRGTNTPGDPVIPRGSGGCSRPLASLTAAEPERWAGERQPMKLEPQVLARPFSVQQFEDGKLYKLPDIEFQQSHLFSEIALIDGVVIKLPSERGFSDYRKFIRDEQPDPDEIRRNEELERYTNYAKLLNLYPVFSALKSIRPESIHYLLVHRLQYDRLKQQDSLAIPESRFVLVNISGRAGTEPAIVQEKVDGTSLWDMFDQVNDEVRPEWKQYLPMISERLKKTLGSRWIPWRKCPLRKHINWNIQNLIFNKDTKLLYYVDSKPSTMYGRSSNEHNIAGIRAMFTV